MSVDKAIQDFKNQLDFEPEIINSDKLKSSDKFIVVGMGGSHLAAGLLKTVNPKLDLLVHRDYSLPRVPDYFLKESLFIASSYSGNTEEVIDSLEEAIKQNLNTAVISTGGKLIEIAKKNNIPYIQVPDTDIQPRMALGFSVRSLLTLMGDKKQLESIAQVKDLLDIDSYERRGEEIAKELNGFVPIIYSSTINLNIAYNWKIKFNETSKIPAFYNVFSELNHNEMNGFDYTEDSKELSSKFKFIFLKDDNDNERIKKRMDITKKLYKDKGFSIIEEKITGQNPWHKVFSSLLTADWTALKTAESYNAEAEEVPMIEEFKKLI